jgi:hypothetical protein
MIDLSEPPGSYQDLCARLQLNAGIPYSEHWSAAADFLELIVDEVINLKPATILECGSGVSTLMLAAACRESGKGRILSLEHQQEYASDLRDIVTSYALQEFATIIDAPLVGTPVNGHDYQWYSLDNLVECDIDMMVIDGPPGRLQKNSRYPALPVMAGRMSPACNIFLDDAARQDEREIVRLWVQEIPGLSSTYIDNERGCSRLRLNP